MKNRQKKNTSIGKRAVRELLGLFYMALSSVVFFYFSQHIVLETDTFSKLKSPEVVVPLNICIIFTCMLLVSVLVGREVIAVGIVGFAVLALSTANFYVWKFRKTELLPGDLLGLKTAGNVASSYYYIHNQRLIYALIVYAVLLLIGYAMFRKKKPHPFKHRLLCLLLCLVVGNYTWGQMATVSPVVWKRGGSKYNGFILNFTLVAKSSAVTEPEGYAEALELLNEQYPAKEDASDSGSENETSDGSKESLPTVIVIMNESLGDFSIFGEFSTGEDPLSYLHSLKENTISGYALTSLYGGGTPTSEYEFLTGNSQAFLPVGSYAYMQFINEPTYSLVSVLADMGYECEAMHPFKASGWRRSTVYDYLGFQRFYTQKDFEDPLLIREYISDESMYEKIIDIYETQTDKPLFLFGVTMQNHGGYDYTGENFDFDENANVYGTGGKETEQYLTLTSISDKAFEKLVSYFKEAEDDVIILMYGDHYPAIGANIYNSLYDGAFNTQEEKMLQYTIPFWIWTNYDIEEQENVRTSINYLSNYLLETAGLKLPAYNRFLKDVQQVIPQINRFSFYSASQQKMLSVSEAEGEDAQMLSLYEAAAYNLLFEDEKEKMEMFR